MALDLADNANHLAVKERCGFSLELVGSRRDGEFRTNMRHMAEEPSRR